MNIEQISDKVRQIVTDAGDIGHDGKVEPTEKLSELSFDSLDFVEMIITIETEFDIDIEQETAETWLTVQDVIDAVANELNIPVKPVINRIERHDVERFRDAAVHFNFPHNTLQMYQEIATKSAIYPGKGTPFGLMYAALGLAEAGEVQNKVKKAFRDDGAVTFETLQGGGAYVNFRPITPERRTQIIKELGGVLWYIAAVCNEINATMSEVALQNLDELCGRGERDTLRGDGDNR